MRILFTTMPAAGHLRPLTPIAHAALRLGHRVAVCTPETARAAVEAHGLEHLPAGRDWVSDDIREAAEITAYPPDHADRLREYLVGLGYPGPEALCMARDVMARAREWRPDVIVRESAEFGGYLAAEALGLPHASVGAAGSTAEYLLLARLAPALDAGRAALGLAPDPAGARVYAYLHANLMPEAYDPKEMSIPNARCYRQANPEAAGEALPPWLAGVDDARPLVFAAFGTMNPRMAAWDGVIRDVAAGLSALDCTAVLATGDRPCPVPANVRAAARLPQPLVLECCDLFVNHGGFNSVREALRLGVPMVIIPWLNDSTTVASRCEEAGVARVLHRDDLTPGLLRDACAQVLADPAYGRNARRLRRQILALPPLEAFVSDLESLVSS